MISIDDITISITTLFRVEELGKTLATLDGFPNVQVILNGAEISKYESLIQKYESYVRFIINKDNIGVAAAWNQGIICSNTRYVVLSSDDLDYTSDWYVPLLKLLNTNSRLLQVSLSHPMSFSSFCIDKRLIGLQGWFDHNFTRGYYEDEDWYLRFRERLNLYNNRIPYEEIIPHLRTVKRPLQKRTYYNRVPNIIYFHLKWGRRASPNERCLFSRQGYAYYRRLPEPEWPLMANVRNAYLQGDYKSCPWSYSRPNLLMTTLTKVTDNRLVIKLGERFSRYKAKYKSRLKRQTEG